MSSIALGLNRILRCSSKFFKKYTPEILIGCGIAGFASSMVMVAKETPRTKEDLDILHEELAECEEEVTKRKIIFEETKIILKNYAPAILTAGVSAGCIFCSNRIKTKRIAVWATAYELTRNDFEEYREEVKKKIGEKKEKEVINSVCQNDLDDDPPPKELYSSEQIITDGKSLFKFKNNGRYFRSSREDILKTVKYISERLITERWIPFNEFQYEFQLDNTEDGDNVGFLQDYGIDVIFEACIAPNGESCQYVIFNPGLMPDPATKYY